MKKHNIAARLMLLGVLAMMTGGLQSCKKSNYVQLEEADHNWILLRDNDSISFVANAGFKVHFIAYNHGKFYKKDGSNYYEGTQIFMRLPSADKQDEGYIGVQKQPDGSTSATLSWPHFKPVVDLINTPLQTANVHGTVYNDLYIVSTPTPTNHMFIKTIWYSRSQGMLKMLDRFGYTYRVIK